MDKQTHILGLLRRGVLVGVGLAVAGSSLWPALAFATGSYPASDLLGQPDYTTTNLNNNPITANASGLNSPGSTVIDSVHHLLFVTDTRNDRILVFSLGASDQVVSRTANYVLGQVSMTARDVSSSISASHMNGPIGLAVDAAGQRLFVADGGANRILVFNTAALSNGMSASYVLGQTSFTTQTTGTTASTLNRPTWLSYDSSGNRLFAADILNYRILVYNVASLANGQAAVNVLGQPDFTTATYHCSSPTATGVCSSGVAYDSGAQNLFVSDSSFSRVMVFPVASITNGEAATKVLGQSNLGSNAGLSGAQALSPNGGGGISVDIAGRRLFVGSSGYVSVFSIASISNGQVATNILGRPTSTSPYPQHPTSASLQTPISLVYDSVSGDLVVSDSSFNRLTIYNVASVIDGQATIDVIGQTTSGGAGVFTSDNINNLPPSATGFDTPSGAIIDPSAHRLFIADTNNNRVLVFNLMVTNQLQDHTADYVIGQNDFTSRIAATSQSGLWQPLQLAFDAARRLLFVADSNNNRIMVFDTTSLASGENASYEVGQADFSSNLSPGTTDAVSIGYPAGLAYDTVHQRLFVSDQDNNRITVYDYSSPQNGQAAIDVIGQVDLQSSDFFGPSQTVFESPSQLAYDPNADRLYAADWVFSQRLLVFDTSGTMAGEPATAVIGNSSFTASWNPGWTPDARTTGEVLGVAFDAVNNRLLLGDSNDRIMMFDTTSISSYQPAVAEIGQPDLTASTYNNPSNDAFVEAMAIAIDPTTGTLWMTDDYEDVALQFDLVHITTGTLSSGTTDQSYADQINSAGSQGAVTYGLASGSLPPGLTLSTSGAVTGMPTQVGTFHFSVQVEDDNAGAGTFVNSSAVSITISQPQAPAAPVSTPAAEPDNTTPDTITSEAAPALLNDQSDFTTTGTTQTLAAGQAVVFTLPDSADPTGSTPNQHTATVDTVGADYVDLTIASDPIHVRLGIGESKLIDVDRDGHDDLQVTLTSILNGSASIIFKQLAAASSTSSTSTITTNHRSNPKPSTGFELWYIAGAAILGATIVISVVIIAQRHR